MTSLDISFFDTSKITDFSYLFYGCTNLKSINLLNFDTSSAQDFECLFYQCHNLVSLDLTNFDTSSLTNMGFMFYKCYSLKTIKFPEMINTYNLESMRSMFNDCNSLIFINLTSFDTSKVTDMRYLFYNCHSLKYLDIPNFSSLNLESIKYMFYKMSSLIYLNINSLEINTETSTDHSFDMLPSNLKICSSKYYMKAYLSNNNKVINCNDICFSTNIKIDLDNNECILSCSNKRYNYECNNVCYNECRPDNSHIILRNISKIYLLNMKMVLLYVGIEIQRDII